MLEKNIAFQKTDHIINEGIFNRAQIKIIETSDGKTKLLFNVQKKFFEYNIVNEKLISRKIYLNEDHCCKLFDAFSGLQNELMILKEDHQLSKENDNTHLSLWNCETWGFIENKQITKNIHIAEKPPEFRAKKYGILKCENPYYFKIKDNLLILLSSEKIQETKFFEENYKKVVKAPIIIKMFVFDHKSHKFHELRKIKLSSLFENIISIDYKIYKEEKKNRIIDIAITDTSSNLYFIKFSFHHCVYSCSKECSQPIENLENPDKPSFEKLINIGFPFSSVSMYKQGMHTNVLAGSSFGYIFNYTFDDSKFIDKNVINKDNMEESVCRLSIDKIDESGHQVLIVLFFNQIIHIYELQTDKKMRIGLIKLEFINKAFDFRVISDSKTKFIVFISTGNIILHKIIVSNVNS